MFTTILIKLLKDALLQKVLVTALDEWEVRAKKTDTPYDDVTVAVLKSMVQPNVFDSVKGAFDKKD